MNFDLQIILALIGFVTVFVLITFEVINKTLAALAGAAYFLLLGLVDGQSALGHIDWEVIFLLVSMMILVGVTQKTGVFQWVAIKMVKAVRGQPLAVLMGMAFITALFSAFLDNVTTMLLLAPINILIAVELGLSPFPFLIVQTLASNIGGTATLIGDPPNIMIGLAAGYGFNDFLINLGPIILIIMVLLALAVWVVFSPRMQVTNESKARIMEMDETRAISNPRLMYQSLTVLILVVVGFLSHDYIHLPLYVIALVGAVAIMIFEDQHGIHHRLQEVEWETIFFFVGLFMMIGGMVDLGIIKAFSQWVLDLTAGNVPTTSYLILWFSGLFSGVIDNIPYVATMIPMVQDLQASMTDSALAAPLWWALSLGACLGGNATLIGASANVVTAGLAQKSGYRITFMHFLKYGVVTMLGSMVVSTLYLWLVILPKAGY